MGQTVDRLGFRYVPGPIQYAAGIVAQAGYAMERVCFSRPIALEDGFRRIEAFLTSAGLPRAALCACELRSPAPTNDADFSAFNRLYLGILERWGLATRDANPVGRTIVSPVFEPPSTPSIFAFSYVLAAADAPPSFFVAASGETVDGTGPIHERIVRYGETGPDAMLDKGRRVLDIIEQRMTAIGASWDCTTAVQAYTAQDLGPALRHELIARGAARHGITWHLCRPPVVGLEIEFDCRQVHRERVIDG